MDELGTTFYAVAALAALLIGLAKGGLSTLGSLATPLLVLVINPVRAAAILLPLFVISDVFGLWMYRRDFDRRNLQILIPAAGFGVFCGWATASLVSERWVGFLVGVIGFVFCLSGWLRRGAVVEPHSADVPRGLLWGSILGFSSFVSHAGGPPYQVYVLPQRLPKLVYAGTTTITFAVVNAIKLIPYWVLGQFSPANLKTAAVLVPVAVAGTFAGFRLVRVLPERIYFNFVQIMMFIVSIKLIADAFVV